MKKAYYLLTLLLLTAGAKVSAQDAINTQQADRGVLFKGVLLDAEVQDVKVAGASIAIESEKDTLRTTSDANGAFTVANVPRGAVQIKINYLGYTPYSFQLLADGTQVNLGNILMTPADFDLDEVSIVGQIQMMTSRGDTVVYNPEAFQSIPGDYAIDLIVKFPGVEIDDEGVLKAHGEEVKWTLVDGRLMFGRDINTTLQNVRADDLEEVKIYDIVDPEKPGAEVAQNKEDMQRVMDFTTKSKFTGAMNLRALGGVGNDIGTDANRFRYKFEGSAGTFSEKSAMALDLFGNNTKDGSTDIMRRFMGGGRGTGYGGGSDGYGRRNSIMAAYSNSNPFIGRNKWQYAARYTFNSNYDFSDSRSQSQRLDRDERTNSSNTSRTGTDTHTLGLRLNKRTDNANITFQPSVTYSDGYSSSDYFREVLLENILQNSQLNDNFQDNNKLSTSGSFNYTKAFPRKDTSSSASSGGDLGMAMMNMFIPGMGGRDRSAEDRKSPISMSLNGGWNYSKNNASGYSDQFTTIITQPDNSTYYLLDIDGSSRGFNTGASVSNLYLAPWITMRASYGFNYTYSKSLKIYADELTEIADPEQSEIYTLNNYRNNASATLDFGKRDSKVSGRLDINYAAIKNLRDESFPAEIDENKLFHSFTPGFTIGNEQRGASITKRYQWNFRYNTSTSQPSLEQLRDYTYEINKFNLAQGNPNLKQSYSHNASGSFVIQDSETARRISFNVGAGYTYNSIVSNTIDLDAGSKLTEYLNQDGAKNASAGVTLSTPFIGNKFILEGNVRYNYRESPTYRNDALIWSESHVPSFEVRLRSNHSATIEYGLVNRTGWDYNFTDLTPKKWTFSERLSANFSIRFLTSFKAEADYSYRYSKTHSANSNIPSNTSNLLNASIGWEFANRAGELRFTVYDILNRESGFTTSTSADAINESWKQIMGRYCMFTASFRIARTYGGTGKGTNISSMIPAGGGGGPRGGGGGGGPRGGMGGGGFGGGRP